MKELLRLTHGSSKTPYLTFYLDEDNALIFKWKGFVTVESIIEAHKQAYDFIRKHRVNTLIEDVVDFTGPFQDANVWFITEFAPKVLKMGLNRCAVILGENIFTQLTVNKLKENPDFKQLGISYRVFDSMHSAKSWLNELKNTVS